MDVSDTQLKIDLQMDKDVPDRYIGWPTRTQTYLGKKAQLELIRIYRSIREVKLQQW